MLKGKKVCLDFGHGGSDSGAIGVMGVLEKNIVFEVGQMLVNSLKEEGVNVVVTRDRDSYVTLKSRCDISNNSNADLFVSLHCNAFHREDARGLEIFHHPNSKRGNELSKIILDDIVEADLYSVNRGVKTSSNLYVLKRTRATAVLVELGFITNYQDLEIIQSNKYTFSKVLTNSIIKCLQKL